MTEEPGSLGRLKAFLAEDDELGEADPEAALDIVARALGLLDGVDHAGQLDDAARARIVEARDRDGHVCPECGRFVYAPDRVDTEPLDCEGCGAPTLAWWETAAHSRRDGERYFARYRLVRELGRGGMGVVYEAFDPDLRRRVAIKALKELDASPSRVERLQREAQLVAGLSHPGIVTVHEVGLAERDGGGPPIPYLVMELASRTDFRQRAQAGDRRERVALLAGIARAVAHAHAQGIVHRDLKPENILLRADGTPIVSDFGLAHRAADTSPTLTRDGAVLGTLPYMAPEQVLGHRDRTGPATDVWALGVVLFELLTGRLPFAGGQAELYGAIPADEPPAPRALDPSIPRDLETVVLKAIEKAPRQRYAHAGELADDLDRWLAGESVLARPIGPLTRWARRARRNPWRLAAALAFVGLIAGGVSWQRRERAAAERAMAEQAIREELDRARLLLSEWGNQRYLLPHSLSPIRRRLMRARDRLLEVAAREPEAHAVRAELGRLHLHLGELDQAQAALETAVTQAPKVGRYRFLLGRVLMRLYEERRLALDRVDPRKFADTRKQLEARLEARRRPIMVAFETALMRFDQEAQRDKDAMPPWMHDYADAVVCWVKGDLVRATDKCQRVAAMHPAGGEEGLMLLGQIATDPAEAVALYDQAIDRARSFAEAYVRAARARVAQARRSQEGASPSARAIVALYTRAVEQARQAVSIDADSLDARLALAEVHLAWGRWTGGGSMPDVDTAREQFTRAIDAYTEATTLAPRNSEAWRGRGEAACELGALLGTVERDESIKRFELSKVWLGEAVELDRGRNARSLIARARMYLAWARVDPREVFCTLAERDVKQALELEPMLEAVYKPLLEQCFSHSRNG